MLYAGIDGGQSSTIAVLGDGTRILGRGVGPPADLVGETRDSPRQRYAIERALDAAIAAAKLDSRVPIDALVAGISGFDPELSRPPNLSSRVGVVRFVHDTVIAHAGALAGEVGIVVIAGTGSVALGNDARSGAYVRAGGWGYFFGDEGSALWVARTAIGLAMRREDARRPSVLGERACTFFGATSLRQIQHAFAHGDLSRSALAAFSRDAFVLAGEAEPDAVVTRDEAARALADLCATLDAQLETGAERRISYSGGLFADRAFVDRFVEAVAGSLSHATVRTPVNDAAAGALALARSLATSRP